MLIDNLNGRASSPAAAKTELTLCLALGFFLPDSSSSTQEEPLPRVEPSLIPSPSKEASPDGIPIG
jgi:hypothetical protein